MGLHSEFNSAIKNRFKSIGSGLSDFFSGASENIGNFIDTTHGWTRNASGSRLTGVVDNLTGMQAQENIEIERQREDTRYQRLMSDLAASGINPSTVLGSGGVSPSNGVSGSITSNLGALGSIISSVADAGLLTARRKNIEADTENKEAKTAGQIIDNMIKNKVGLDQALAQLNMTYTSESEKKANAQLLVQKYLTETQSTEKTKYDALNSEYLAKINQGKFDELKRMDNFNNFVVTVSESQLVSAGIDVAKIFGGKGKVSQSTTHPVPLAWLCRAQDKTDPERQKYIDKISWFLSEDIGTMKKDLNK